MTNTLNEKWNEVCNHVASFDDVNKPEFTAFMDRVQPQAMSDGFLLVTVENDFLKNRIEQHFSDSIKRALEEIYGMPFVVDIEVDEGSSARTQSMPMKPVDSGVHKPNTEVLKGDGIERKTGNESEAQSSATQTSTAPSAASPFVAGGASISNTPAGSASPSQQMAAFRTLTFENFVIGESNRMAYSMAVQVAEAPGRGALNPLFIYGKSGLGKTHLMRAIQNYANETKPEMVTVYADSEEIVSKYTEASLTKNIDKSSYNNFKAQYENADILLIDDVQFLQGKAGTLDIVFQIFNKLINQGKQIVLSADRAPKNIDIEERYNSRFMQGGTIDIQPPDVETKLAIVKSYINEYRAMEGDSKIGIPEPVQMYVAENSGSNIRELKGAINLIIYRMGITENQDITIDEVKSMLVNHFTHGMSRNITVEDIQKEVEDYYKIKHSEMIGSSRAREVVYPRQIAMYLCRQLLDRPFTHIAEKFNRDHATVMHSVKKLEKSILTNRDVQEEVESLKKRINEI